MFPFVILAGLGTSSLIEYLLHRFYLHRSPKEPHILKHHKNFNGETSYSQIDSKKSDIVSSDAYLFVNFALYFPFGSVFYQLNHFWGLLFFFSAIGYTFWVEYAHLLFHRPDKKPIEKTALFKAVKEHHRIHHMHYRRNYGIGSDWWDKIIKTNKKTA